MKRLFFLRAGFLSLLGGIAVTDASYACSGPVSYKAVISERDLHNSSGANLITLGAVVRQDRANYHKFSRRDAGDEGDTVLSDDQLRIVLERAVDAAYPDHDVDPFYWDAEFGTRIAVTFWYCGGTPRAEVQELGIVKPSQPHPGFDRPGAEDRNRELDRLPLPPPN